MHTCSYAHSHAQIHYTFALVLRILTHILPNTRVLHTLTHVHTHACSCTCSHPPKCVLTHIHSTIHTYSHAQVECSHTLMRAHTCTDSFSLYTSDTLSHTHSHIDTLVWNIPLTHTHSSSFASMYIFTLTLIYKIHSHMPTETHNIHT